jgi:hypothetical protein
MRLKNKFKKMIKKIIKIMRIKLDKKINEIKY